MNPLFEDYKDKPWLIHTETEPSQKTKNCIPRLLELSEKYPIAPGNELDYFDDTTPDTMIREDITTAGGVILYKYTPKNLDPGEKRVIYYIHGGGFMRGNTNWCRANAICHVRNFGLPAYAATYRYTPEFKYPAGLEDAEDGYHYMVNKQGHDPSDIIVTGDSAGATYMFALCGRLKRQGKKLPGRLISMSGFLDFTFKGASYKYNLGKDIMFTAPLDESVHFYTDEPDATNPDISPIYMDFTGLPPAFFTADDTEVFVSDALTAADKMDKAGIPVKAHIMHGLWHDFLFETPEIEESKLIYKELSAWLNS
ncbi:MAG: alpha/beta hydrolase [Treponema sp.]|jgi:acetyl esterase/lipase|nr:alpha/beta hydrolase [Treponema sp.]